MGITVGAVNQVSAVNEVSAVIKRRLIDPEICMRCNTCDLEQA
jgi:hypothetical protein